MYNNTTNSKHNIMFDYIELGLNITPETRLILIWQTSNTKKCEAYYGFSD